MIQVPNRVNYICWIEDLMKNEFTRPICGIDIGTGASCIYPLLGCTRNKNWKMVATEIDDRSIEFAHGNVTRNKMQHIITIMKSSPPDIFPSALFEDSGRTYNFCMCNPPFYKDELDIQDGLEAKEGKPSAVCQGTSSEMMTTGGEVQFVKQMIDESIQWQTRIRWYTTMLGKKSSVDKIVAHLKGHKASMQNTSNKLLKMAAPTTVLSFEVSDMAIDKACNRVETILDRLSINHQTGTADIRDPEGIQIIQATARANTWSRAARRAQARQANNQEKGNASTGTLGSTAPNILDFDIRLFAPTERQESSDTALTPQSALTIQLTWTFGQDRELFESFFLHLRSRVVCVEDP
ncbi:hypothetical protein BGZ65_007627 [Modicella reniformis]|uniref:U6 small nuclear RNA (adenine-(43)-N(6))-methyltransferase n=1 Tax=Modicella reniformis TaxID=1440133 RepID=A0A9P6MAU9_9FUNG|nr:hypothetical protein BGZ65_007627 [Modicella reniformis]